MNTSIGSSVGAVLCLVTAIPSGAATRYTIVTKTVSVKTETMEVTELEMLESSQIPEGTFSMPKCRQVGKGEMEKKAKRFIKDTLK